MKYSKLLEQILHELEDEYLGTSRSADMLINGPLYATFCEANRDSISEQTIVLMALQVIAKDFDITMSYQLDEWIERFKECALKHILNN